MLQLQPARRSRVSGPTIATIFLGLIMLEGQGNAQERIVRYSESIGRQCGAVRGSSCASWSAGHAGSGTVGGGDTEWENVRRTAAAQLSNFRNSNTFMVYTAGQIDELLRQRELANQANAAALKREVLDAVTSSLRAMPGQLFSDQVRRQLADEVATRIQSIMETRLQADRTSREQAMAQLEERLARLEAAASNQR